MKRTILVLLICVLALPLAAQDISWARTNLSYGDDILTFTLAADSAEVDTSDTFTMERYNGVSWTSYPFPAYLKCVTSPAGGAWGITFYIDKCPYGTATWSVIDTIFSAATANAWASVNFENEKAAKYRLRSKVTATKLEEDTTGTFTLELHRYQLDQ